MENIQKYESIDVDGVEHLKISDKYKAFIEETKYNHYLSKSNIPKEYHDLDFDSYEGSKSIGNKDKCFKYSTECKEDKFQTINLYLTGSYGTQKTTIASCIGKEFIRQGYKVQFVYASELLDLLMKDQGFNYIDDVQKAIKKYMSVDLLIVDDFGKGVYWKNSPELIIDAWDKFLRKFISMDKRILLTSNYSLGYMNEHYGESLYALLHRNFEELNFLDSIHEKRRERFNNLWD